MSLRVRDHLERRAVVALSGREGERLFTGRYSHINARVDCRDANEFIWQITRSNDEESDAHFKLLAARARKFFRAPIRRPQLDAIVDALLVRGSLSEPEVEDIVAAVSEAWAAARARR
jgi:hypothetical protein